MGGASGSQIKVQVSNGDSALSFGGSKCVRAALEGFEASEQNSWINLPSELKT